MTTSCSDVLCVISYLERLVSKITVIFSKGILDMLIDFLSTVNIYYMYKLILLVILLVYIKHNVCILFLFLKTKENMCELTVFGHADWF